MGLTLQIFFAVYLALNFLAVCFLGWVLSVMGSIATVAWSQSGTAGRRAADDVLCPFLLKGHSALQVTMGFSLTSIGFTFSSVIYSTVESILFFALCRKCDDITSLPSAMYVVDIFADACRSVGYLFMFVSHFERLRLTFATTVLRLPQWAPKILYAFLLLSFPMLAGVQAFQKSKPVVSIVLLVLLFSLYIFVVIALIRIFYKKLIATANGRSNTLDAAVRVCLSVSVSFVTTFGCLVLVTLFFVFGERLEWDFTRRYVLVLDMTLNAFCLMCTFKQAETHFLRAFGRLFRYFRARVAPTTDQPPFEIPAMTNIASETASKIASPTHSIRITQ